MDTSARTAGLLHPNDVIDGRYRVIKTVGEGGMGTVYLAEHTLIKRRVAVKVLHPELASDGKVVDRFMREARAAGTLGHPNIVESTDMGFMEGAVPYIVFEYLEGTLLTDEIYRLGVMPVRRAVKIAQQIASALHAAHAAGIIHRDLKADNIFLTDRGEMLDHVKVLDFGISKFLEAGDERTRRGMIMGTPEFMAPEQITTPDSVDARSDVYALGVIMYEMLAGRRPFTNDDPRTLLHRIVHTDAPPIDRAEVPRGLHDLVFKLLEKEPDERVQTMADVDAVLDLYTTQGDITPARRLSRTAEPTRRETVPAAVPGTAPIARVTPAETAQPMRGRALTPVPARPSQVMSPRETPWPDTLAPPLEAPRAKPPWVLYALVACGLLVGAIGLWVGLRRTEVREVTVAPAPAPGPAAAIPAPAPVQKVAVTISADAPGARVTFRRRVSNAPFTLEVAPTDIVELVEVSAPNRKTVRYWLTIDRATTLHAKLPKGAGNTEATEEETLVALGEAQLQAPAAVAAAPEAPKPAAAKPVKASAKPSPRKIGKAVAVVDDAPAPAVDAPAELAAEAPAPEPAADTAPAPAPAPAPDAAAAAPASLEVAKAAPAAVEVKPPAPKPIEASVVEKTVTAQVMAKNRPDVVACYQQAKKDNGKLKGSVTVSMTVDASGAISRPQVNSTLGSPTVAACILKAMRSWKFPARAGAPTGTASYKFALQ